MKMFELCYQFDGKCSSCDTCLKRFVQNFDSQQMTYIMYEGYVKILVEKSNKILFVKFNNIAKKNCLNVEAYLEIGRVLRAAANDESITIVVFTGVGDFFSAGNDLTAISSDDSFEIHLRKNNDIFKELISALIDCPKILVALVNGPAIGIGATLAGLCDLIWCEENAYFLTPFTRLGLVPEGCSSYLLPLFVGRSKATELLLFSEKLTSKDALQYNFVSRIFKLADLDAIILPKLKEYSELPPHSMYFSKKLIRSHEKETLYKVLNNECDELLQRYSSEEFLTALLDFAMRKNKSKL